MPEASPKIRVLIADDHPVVRQGLRQMLEAEPDLAVVAEATGGHEVLDISKRTDWDVAVLDYNMPGKAGVDLVKELRSRYAGRPVLMLSIHPEERHAFRVLKAGAAGYLTKETATEELVNAIRKVSQGGRYVSPALGEMLANEMVGGGERAPHEKLSDREFQVLWMIASGKRAGDIARELYLSPNTVSTYRTRVLAKINARNNAELMRYALRHNLVD